MARILIIGGTGFVGSNLVRYFQRTHSVIIANRREPRPTFVQNGGTWT